MSESSVQSSEVLDKISAILVCQMVPGTKTEKFGRSGEKHLAIPELNPELLVFLHHGIKYKATGKVDGTCTLVRNGSLWKRRDIKDVKQQIPTTWVCTGSEKPGHQIGFMPIEPGDLWYTDCHPHTIVFTEIPDKRDPTGIKTRQIETKKYDMTMVRVLDVDPTTHQLSYQYVPITSLEGHTVEVMGPKFQTNPHKLKEHCLMRHGMLVLDDFPDLLNPKTDILTDIKHWFDTNPKGPYLEGVVIHLENGKMFKIHRHHLDLEWNVDKIPPLDQIPL